MVIAVPRGMSALKDRLQSIGYKVVYSDECGHNGGHNVDAIVYSAAHGGGLAFTGNSPVMHDCTTSFFSSVNDDFFNGGHGCAMYINSAGKRIDEIVDEITRYRVKKIF